MKKTTAIVLLLINMYGICMETSLEFYHTTDLIGYDVENLTIEHKIPYVSHKSPYIKKGSIHHLFTKSTDNTDVIVQSTQLGETIEHLMECIQNKTEVSRVQGYRYVRSREDIQSQLYSLVSTLLPHRNKHNKVFIKKNGTLYAYPLNGLMKEIVRENPVNNLKNCVHKWAKHYVHLQDLFDAIKQKDQGTIEYLTHLGPLCCLDVHHVASLTHFGITALEHAFQHNNHKAVAHLLHTDFNIFKDANYSNTEHKMIKACYELALLWCRVACQEALEKELFDHLLSAINSDNKNRVYRLAHYKALINMRDILGNTPLHVATDQRNDPVDVVGLFISMGANVNVCNGFGNTLLSNAAGRFNTKCVKKLLKAGAPTDDVIHFGQYAQSLLELPVICGKKRIVRALVDHGIHVPQKYSELAEKGWITPHGNSIKYVYTEISRLLKETYYKQQILASLDVLQFFPIIIKNKIIAMIIGQRECI